MKNGSSQKIGKSHAHQRYAKFNFSSLNLKTKEIYNNFDYSLDDFDSYINFKSKTQLIKFDELQARLFRRIHDQDTIEKAEYFRLKSEFYMFDSEKLMIPINITVFSGLIASPINYIREVAAINDPSEFMKNTKSIPIRNLLRNTMNGIWSAYTLYSSYIYGQLKSSYELFIPYLTTSIATLLLLTSILLIASSICILLIKRIIDSIYSTMMNLRQSDFNKRIDMMTALDSTLNTFKKEFFCKDFIGTKSLVIDERNAAKAEFKISKTQHKRVVRYTLYGLGSSLGIILFYYLLQMLLYFIILYLFRANISRILWVAERHNIVRELLLTQQYSYNALQQELIFGDRFFINGQIPSSILKTIGEDLRNQSALALSLDQAASDKSIDSQLSANLTIFSQEDLCKFVPSLKDREELCDLLDNKIPGKGYLQSFLRNSQYLSDFYKTIDFAANDKDRSQYLNDPEFVEWEFTLEEVYWECYEFLLEYTTSAIERICLVVIEGEVKNGIRTCTLLFGFFSVIFIGMSFKNISNKIKTAMFNVQVIPISLIVDNSIMKIRFIELLRLNKNYF